MFLSVFIDVQIDQMLANEEEMKHQQIPLSSQDEDQSENSFDEGQTSILDQLGVKIDQTLHRMFTSYVHPAFSVHSIE